MRVIRSGQEKRRVGQPTDSERIEILEDLITLLLPSGSSPAKTAFLNMQNNLDDLDIKHPNDQSKNP